MSFRRTFVVCALVAAAACMAATGRGKPQPSLGTIPISRAEARSGERRRGGTRIQRPGELGWSGTADVPWTDSTGTAAALFGGAAGTVNLSGNNNTANALIFNTAGYTVSNGIVTLAGSSPAISMNATSGTISSVIAGTSGMAYYGPGNLWLSNTNTLSGGLSINSGTLTVNVATSGGTGSFANSAITVANGAYLDLNAGDG